MLNAIVARVNIEPENPDEIDQLDRCFALPDVAVNATESGWAVEIDFINTETKEVYSLRMNSVRAELPGETREMTVEDTNYLQDLAYATKVVLAS